MLQKFLEMTNLRASRSDVLAIARRLTETGHHVVPITPGEKRPSAGKGWQHLRLAPEQLDDVFQDGNGIGILLGEASKGWLDVDLDTENSRKHAHRFLHTTPLKHGHQGDVPSHWHYYRLEGGQGCPRTIQLTDPVPQPGVGGELVHSPIAELRGTGGQTVIPPSIHPSDVPLVWDGQGEPARYPYKSLLRSVHLLWAACVLGAHWPKGQRHRCAVAIAGTLLPSGYTEKEASKVITAAAAIANDEDETTPGQRAREAIPTTMDRMKSGAAYWGRPELTKALGEEYGGTIVDALVRELNLTSRSPVPTIGGKRPATVVDFSSGKRATTPEPIEKANTIESAGLPEPEPIENIRNWFASYKAPEPLIPMLIDREGICLWYGHPRSMKSLAAMAACFSLTTGAPLFGLERFTPRRRGVKTLYVTNEDFRLATSARFEALMAGGVPEPPAESHYNLIREGVDLDDPAWWQHLAHVVGSLGIEFVVFDPLRSFTGAVDAGPQDLQPFVKRLRQFEDATRACLLLVHHTTKESSQKDHRSPSQRVSGGGIFSISPSPVFFKKVGDSVAIAAPVDFKNGPTPSSFAIIYKGSHDPLTGLPDEMELAGEDDVMAARAKAREPADVEAVLAFVVENPGSTYLTIADGVFGETRDERVRNSHRKRAWRAVKTLENDSRALVAPVKGSGDRVFPTEPDEQNVEHAGGQPLGGR